MRNSKQITDKYKTNFVVFIYYIFFSSSELVSGRLDTSGSMIPLLVPEISPWAFFVTVQGGDEEVGILVVGFLLHRQDF